MSDEYAAIAELYDHVIAYRDRPDVAFFVEAAREAGSPVLELGSGTGRVLIPVARAGVEIVGLDASPSMLAVCRERLEQEPESVRQRAGLVEGDMRSFDLPRKFTLAMLPFRPFQHLVSVSDQLACLGCIHRHLVPGGRLILDLFNPSLDALVNRPLGEEVPEGPGFSMPDGRRVTRSFRIAGHDRATQVNQVELIYHLTHEDGREERLVQAFAMRYLFRYEAEHLLARAGFEIEHVYAGYDRSAYGSIYPGELIFVAKSPSHT
ncbi:MAG TPA: class I SAM-dependent methyltransferase [Gemmatimonadales bacterium]|nr:class I SAM-dependent methyltransferase [Gemmatimonadales bacterium]